MAEQTPTVAPATKPTVATKVAAVVKKVETEVVTKVDELVSKIEDEAKELKDELVGSIRSLEERIKLAPHLANSGMQHTAPDTPQRYHPSAVESSDNA